MHPGRWHPTRMAQRMTCLLFALYGNSHWASRVPTIILVAYAIVRPHVIRRQAFWLVFAVAFGLGLWPVLIGADNHKYLMLYWLLALAICQTSGSVALAARSMIGIAFALATAWKLACGQFFDGSFLLHEALIDPRFSGLARALGITAETQAANLLAWRQVQVHDVLSGAVELGSTAQLRLVMTAGSWLTLVVEAAIGSLFMLATLRSSPIGGKWESVLACRNGALIAFCWMTYPIATVVGFSWLLCTLGVAQCGAAEVKSRYGYLVTFAATQLFTLPWSQMLAYLI